MRKHILFSSLPSLSPFLFLPLPLRLSPVTKIEWFVSPVSTELTLLLHGRAARALLAAALTILFCYEFFAAAAAAAYGCCHCPSCSHRPQGRRGGDEWVRGACTRTHTRDPLPPISRLRSASLHGFVRLLLLWNHYMHSSCVGGAFFPTTEGLILQDV